MPWYIVAIWIVTLVTMGSLWYMTITTPREEDEMFDLTKETKDEIVKYLREAGVIKEGTTDLTLELVLDNVVTIVKRQFGF